MRLRVFCVRVFLPVDDLADLRVLAGFRARLRWSASTRSRIGSSGCAPSWDICVKPPTGDAVLLNLYGSSPCAAGYPWVAVRCNLDEPAAGCTVVDTGSAESEQRRAADKPPLFGNVGDLDKLGERWDSLSPEEKEAAKRKHDEEVERIRNSDSRREALDWAAQNPRRCHLVYTVQAPREAYQPLIDKRDSGELTVRQFLEEISRLAVDPQRPLERRSFAAEGEDCELPTD